MKINDWYIENVLMVSEGLKYFPAAYKLTVLEITDAGYYNVKIEFDDVVVFYDIPPSQLINEGDKDDKENSL